MTRRSVRAAADAFIAAANAGDAKAALDLFASNAIIDDPSTGHRFEGQAGVDDYFQRYFIAYHTVTRFLSIEPIAERCARVRVDFTGDFGHEIGLLDITLDAEGRIVRIDADLE